MKPAPPVMRMFLGVYSASAVLGALPLLMVTLGGLERSVWVLWWGGGVRDGGVRWGAGEAKDWGSPRRVQPTRHTRRGGQQRFCNRRPQVQRPAASKCDIRATLLLLLLLLCVCCCVFGGGA